ncbi:hypothetical protein [Lentzea sp.]|uniref:hypothetical protein n=1 Tax=Lentzea sp. TaxID=56099 RepID=UPI002ED5E3F7
MPDGVHPAGSALARRARLSADAARAQAARARLEHQRDRAALSALQAHGRDRRRRHLQQALLHGARAAEQWRRARERETREPDHAGDDQRQQARGTLMSDRKFGIRGPVIGSNVSTSGRTRSTGVHIGHIQDVSAVLRLLDELREDLNDAQAPTSTIEAVDDLRIEARKPQPRRDVTDHLMEKLADRGLGEQMRELAKAFDALF